MSQNGMGSIPGQGTCLGGRFYPLLGHVPEATDECFSLLLSLSPFLYHTHPHFPLSLRSIKYILR